MAGPPHVSTDDDTTELARLRAEIAALQARLRASEQQAATLPDLKALLENSPDVITLMTCDGKLVYLNRTVPGRTLSEVVGTDSFDYLPPGHRDRFAAAFARALETGAAQQFEAATVSGNRWQGRLIPLKEGDRVASVLGIGTEVTEQRQAEQAQRESEQKLRLAVEATGMGLWTWDGESGSVTLDPVAKTTLGISEPADRFTLADYLSRIHVEDRAGVERSMQHALLMGRYDDLEHRVLLAGGQIRWIHVKATAIRDAAGRTTGFLGGLFDVTSRKRLEQQLRVAQKMEAVGQLTAGIAHNFNNMLAVILPNLEMAQKVDGATAAAHIDDAMHAARRAAEMVRQLMLFARQDGVVRKSPVDVRSLLVRTVEICRATFDRKIELGFRAESGPLVVIGNANELEQAFMNVLLNARDAVGAAATAKIDVSIAMASTGGTPMARVEIRDNGIGMDEQTRERVFEPFFTTKEIGRGTGLGLASAFAVVRDHGGAIHCESESARGTTFAIELPATAIADRDGQIEARHDLGTGGETILIVDDEALVRRATRAVLESAGYRTLEAEDGAQAIRVFRRYQESIALILLDLSMPGQSGLEVLEELRRIAIDAKIVVFSGLSDIAVPEGVRVLRKPVPMQRILSEIRNALDD